MKVTADLHIGDGNMARLWGFDSKDQMAAHMVGIWNRDVCGDEEVWVLGDFITKASFCSVVDRLAGRIHLIRGNHETPGVIKRLNRASNVYVHGWTHSIQSEDCGIEGPNRTIVLTHKYHPNPGKIVLHGHSHGMGAGDVGINTWDRLLDNKEAVRWAEMIGGTDVVR